jgi:hypothetical protein
VAKGQQRSNREKRKPKADKAQAVPKASISPFPPAPGMAKPKGPTSKKHR